MRSQRCFPANLRVSPAWQITRLNSRELTFFVPSMEKQDMNGL